MLLLQKNQTLHIFFTGELWAIFFKFLLYLLVALVWLAANMPIAVDIAVVFLLGLSFYRDCAGSLNLPLPRFAQIKKIRGLYITYSLNNADQTQFKIIYKKQLVAVKLLKLHSIANCIVMLHLQQEGKKIFICLPMFFVPIKKWKILMQIVNLKQYEI